MVTNARDDFYTFVRLIAPTILPEDFIDGVHVKLICEKLQEVAESVANPALVPKRLQIFLPPGSMKSKTASNLFPAWCLGKHPNWCFLALGSDFEFAVDNFGRPTKDIIDSDYYKAIFPNTILKKDVQSAGRWDTTKKGRFVARGAGQNIAGRRAHISICDDVISEQTTKNDLKKINSWYRKGLRTRLLPRGAEIIINTRWFVDDLSGFMEKVDQDSDRPWEIIKIPALLDAVSSNLLLEAAGNLPDEERFAEGTSFWPEFWPTDLLLERKQTTPPNEWAALYQQSPISDEGAIIKRTDFQLWEEETPPPCRYVVVSMDTAFSVKESADYSAYSVWGVFTNTVKTFDNISMAQDCLILLGAGKGKWDFAGLCAKAQDLNDKYSPEFFIVEDKASGQSLIPELRKRSIPIQSYLPDRDKMFRLQATTPYFQSNRIFIPKEKEWADDLVTEVISFPKAPNDDLTDTVSQAILWMRDNFMIDNDGYSNSWMDEENDYDAMRRAHKPNTYWGSLTAGLTSA
jgi:predicted phage terminase large subunit-like protein